MHDLIPLGPALPGVLTTAEIDATMACAEAEKALATRAAYAPRTWRDFAAWCASRGATALPAHVGIVAAYLSGLADSGRKSSTIGRRAAAIGYHHKMAGHEPPTNGEGVRAVLRGIRRTIGSARQGKAPATADLIGHMLALCPANMIGRRDRARLAFGFAGAFRRSELCALEVADLTETPDGLRVLIRRSEGDQEGQGQEVAIPPAAAGSVRSRRCRHGWRQPRSALGRCSARWGAAAAGGPRSGLLRRPQPALGVPHLGSRVRRLDLEAQRSEPATSRSIRCAATSGAWICSRNAPGRRSCEPSSSLE
jgi:integrase